jgi:hypothetical protein
MKQLFAATLIAVASTSLYAAPTNWPVDLELKAVAHQFVANPNEIYTTRGDFYLNARNNSNVPQKISIVYKHCTTGAICVQGEDTYTLQPNEFWGHQWVLLQPRLYAYGRYEVGDKMDVRVDSTGKHTTDTDRSFGSSQ